MTLDYAHTEPRDSAVLTGSYVAGNIVTPGTAFDLKNQNTITLYVNFTKGSLTTMELIMEYSNDGTTWFQEVASLVSGGTSTESLLLHSFGTAGTYRLPFQIKDRYARVSVKGTGTATGSLCAITAIYGQV